MVSLSGESGVRPERARRRKVRIQMNSLAGMPQFRDGPLEKSEKVVGFMHQVGISGSESLIQAAVAGFGKIYFKENTWMNKNSFKKMLSLIACIVLIAAMALVTTGCSDNTESTETPDPSQLPVTVIGEGETVFYFIAVDLDGVMTKYEVHTNETTVGAALIGLELISGDMGEYGLYVKTVNGVTLDWDTHGKYWALYIGEEYALTGVDQVEIVPGTTYTFQPA